MVVDRADRLRRRSCNTEFAVDECTRLAGGKTYPPAFLRGWPSFGHRCGYNEEQ